MIVYFLFLLFYPQLESSGGSGAPSVQNGVLDASRWNFTENGILRLDGVWSFYPNELADPNALPADRRRTIRVPHNWKSEPLHQKARSNGTYEVTVRLPAEAETRMFGIRVANVRMSHHLYVNGKLVHRNGTPSEDKATHTPLNTPYTVYVQPEGGSLHLVMQVSNFLYPQGGIAESIRIGTAEQIAKLSQLSFGMYMAGVFVMFSFGIYSLFIFQMREKERIYLHAGLFFWCSSFAVSASNEKVLMVILDFLPFVLLYKIQDLSIVGTVFLFLMLYRATEPDFISPRLFRLAVAPLALYGAAILALPYEWYTNGKTAMFAYETMLCLLLFVRWLVLAWKADGREKRLEHVLMLMTALSGSGIFLFMNLYLENRIGSSSWVVVFFYGFVLTINLFLAKRSTNEMNKTEKLSEQLWQANEMKNEFLQRTSHELKTPLHGIQNIAEHVMRDARRLSDEQRQHLRLIADTASRLSLLVNDLVDVIHLRSTAIQATMRTVDLAAVVEHAFRLAAFQIDGKRLELANRVPAGIFVRADEQRLQQVITNLCSNAVKYSLEGEIAASAFVEAETVTFTLSDQGIGIRREEWELVFQDAYRSDGADAATSEGMGLGLFISRSLARQMEGELYVADSQLGRGTTFALRLKRAEDGMFAARGMTAAAFSPDAETPALLSGERKTILLVDDDPANVEVLKLTLQADYNLEVAYRAEEALFRIERRRADLLITDLVMPGMSGIELTRRVRQTFSALSMPIIVATARSLDRDVQLAYEAGANDYIAKPFSAEEIRKRVQLLLQLSATMETALRHERAFLAAQIKPHFLYNALNNIIAVCYEEPERAAELLTQLSRYLRHLFQKDSSAQSISLRQELGLVHAYVEIEKLRFEDRLRFETEIEPALLDGEYRIKTLLIQPLVENAIRHGLFDKEGVGTVKVTVRRLTDELLIVVEDDGVGMEGELVERLMAGRLERGVGLSNVRSRVAGIPSAVFDIRSAVGRGTTVTLRLPVES